MCECMCVRLSVCVCVVSVSVCEVVCLVVFVCYYVCINVCQSECKKVTASRKKELRGIFQPYLGPCGTFSILNRERLFKPCKLTSS